MDLLYLYRLKNEIGIMLIIEMAKIELIGGHIGFMVIIEIAKIEN